MTKRFNLITRPLRYKERSFLQFLQPWKSFAITEFIKVSKDSPEYETASYETILINGKEEPFLINWEDQYAEFVESWYGIS